jgi:hypothetical protein
VWNISCSDVLMTMVAIWAAVGPSFLPPRFGAEA